MFQGPEPDDIFFGIVRRGAAMIMFNDVAAEFSSRDIKFFEPLTDTGEGLRGFELQDADGYVLFFGRPRA